MKITHLLLVLIVLGLAIGGVFYANQLVTPESTSNPGLTVKKKVGEPDDWVDLEVFKGLFSKGHSEYSKSLQTLEENWKPGYTTMLYEAIRMLKDKSRSYEIVSLVQKMEDIEISSENFLAWSDMALNNFDIELPDYYSEFKAYIHNQMDETLGEYFLNNPGSKIRLSEVAWGGINKRDSIPPLKDPKMIPASEAIYLDDSNVVFGIEINGDARAYPKRILAWHEMFKGTVGGESVNGVYCTLCGSMILYSTVVDGKHYELGTSGFLYRSNKLMYDQETKSMWSTLEGVPVIGPLIDKGIKLKPLQVVTTTWGKWRELHPDTTVLSLETGAVRDYSEGAAYRNYFDDDDLMYPVPYTDTQLKNKAEVLAIRFDETTDEKLAITADFLLKNRIYQSELGGIEFVVITDSSGANRVYETGGKKFVEQKTDEEIVDSEGNLWTTTESGLIGADKTVLNRLPAHRTFWFGWYAKFPDTKLVN